MTIKTCIDCGQEKPLEAFQHNRTCVDGHLNFCRKCGYLRKKARRLNPPDLSPQGELPVVTQAMLAQLEAYKFEAQHPAWGKGGKMKRRLK